MPKIKNEKQNMTRKITRVMMIFLFYFSDKPRTLVGTCTQTRVYGDRIHRKTEDLEMAAESRKLLFSALAAMEQDRQKRVKGAAPCPVEMTSIVLSYWVVPADLESVYGKTDEAGPPW